MDNVGILSFIRSNASGDFQERIPKPTSVNIADIATDIMTYKQTKEEFCDVLLNKIVKQIVMTKMYENPYKFFKKEPLPYGKTIEMIMVDLIKAKDFSHRYGDGTDAGSLISTEKPTITPEYHSENFKHKYKISVSDDRLKSAFLNANGLQALTNEIVNTALTSAEYDEYLLIKDLLNLTDITEVELTGYSALTTDNARAKMLTKSINTYISYFSFLRKDFNKQGYYTHSKGKDIVIIVTPEMKAELDVELLATAFHMDKAQVAERLVLIDGFEKNSGTKTEPNIVPDDDTLAIVCDVDLIQFRDTLNTTESFRNGDTLTTNLFIHRWGSASATNFVLKGNLTISLSF